MKKILFFAIALVAGASALTSCDSKKDNIDSPIVGTWFYADDAQDYFYTFGADGSYQRVEDYYMNGRDVVAHEHIVGKGSYKINGDIIDATLNSILVYMDGAEEGDDFSEFWPSNEQIKFSLKGDKLALTHDYDTGYAWTETLTRKNAPSDPTDPTDVNPEDYLNTMWRIDSVYMEGEKSRPPHGIIRVLDNTTVVINGDTTSYAFQDGKLLVRDYEFSIVGVKKGWAHLSDRGGDIYLSQLPALDIENQIYTPQASDFVGTWKHAYYVGESHIPGEPVWHREGSNPWVETWEFKEDGTCIYKDWFSGETTTGTWLYDYGILFVNNPLEGTLVDENDRITVQPLTKNWFQILRGDGTNYSYWWFVRVQ